MPNYAAWVEPIASRYHDSHEEAVERARTLNEDQLALPTGDSGWSVRDELAHMAASDEDFMRTLEAVVKGERADLSVFDDIDARNARNQEAWKQRSVAQISDALSRNDTAILELLGQLKGEDEQRTPDGFPFPLEQMLQGYAMHHPYHLEQIAGALAGHPLQG